MDAAPPEHSPRGGAGQAPRQVAVPEDLWACYRAGRVGAIPPPPPTGGRSLTSQSWCQGARAPSTGLHGTYCADTLRSPGRRPPPAPGPTCSGARLTGGAPGAPGASPQRRGLWVFQGAPPAETGRRNGRFWSFTHDFIREPPNHVEGVRRANFPRETGSLNTSKCTHRDSGDLGVSAFPSMSVLFKHSGYTSDTRANQREAPHALATVLVLWGPVQSTACTSCVAHLGRPAALGSFWSVQVSLVTSPYFLTPQVEVGITAIDLDLAHWYLRPPRKL